MAVWKDDEIYCLAQNRLHNDPTFDAYVEGSSSPVLNSAYAWENIFNYVPGRPTRFAITPLSTKKIRVDLGGNMSCDCFAVVDVHSNQPVAQSGDISVEKRIQVKLTRGIPETTIVQDWTATSGADFDQFGSTIFGIFTSAQDGTWTFHLRVHPSDGALINDASIGCIMLGRRYKFPQGPLIEHRRTAQAAVTQTGRDFGAVTSFVRDGAIRRLNVRSFHATDSGRAELERLVVGRGRRREIQGTELARMRLDIPTVLITPEAWNGASDNYGLGIFGRFTGYQSSAIPGGQALSEVGFEEIP